MAYFQLGDQQLPLRVGSQRVATDASAQLRLPSGEPTASAVVVVNGDGSAIIQKAAADSVVKVNGVLLGAEPSPLIHGDRVEIGGHDLRYGDTKQAGSTQFVSSSAVADAIKSRLGVPAKPTTATGGRLVSLVDGREYTVPNSGLVIGRDPSADVVVPTTEVSRKHVQIAPAEQGYLLTDLSTNGVWINGVRVVQQQILGRADVIKVANEEFRFYADVAKAAPAAAAAATTAPIAVAPPPPPPPPAIVAPPATPAAAAVPSAALAPTMPPPSRPPSGAPAPPPPATPAAPPAAPPARPSAAPVAPTPSPKPAPPPPPPPAAVAPPKPAPAPSPAPPAPPAVAGRPALATLEVINEGPDKGKAFEVRGPLTNIGRGAHNDLVIASESVSDSHAKLQMRESGWFVVDIDSTNGTYVGGRRVKGEQLIEGAPDLRFGDIKVAFRPTGAARVSDKATRAITGVSVEEARRRSTTRQPVAPAPVAAPAAEPAAKSGGMPVWVWAIVALVALGAVAAYVLRGIVTVVLAVAARTDVGMVRSGNEDNYHADADETHGIFVVADGMGGHAAGEVASEMAVQIVTRELASVRDVRDAASSARVMQSLKTANRAIYERMLTESDKQGMGTTASLLLMSHEHYLIGQVGDSRVYLLRDGLLTQLTKDHSYVQEQVDAGFLTPEQARYHPYSNVITRCVGAGEEVQPDVYAGELKVGDVFLVASDGLTGMVDDRRLQQLLLARSGPGRIVDALIAEANGRGGLDNITAIVVRVEGLENG